MKFTSRGAIALIASLCLYSNSSAAKSVSVMAYNVENFFNTTHDAETEDWTYLPMSVKKSNKEAQKYCQSMSEGFYKEQCLTMDWNEKAFESHVRNTARVIKAYSPAGPDVIILSEIENIDVVNKLADKGLTGLYKYRELAEGDDSRGISIGVLSKYPITSTKHYSTHLNGKKLNTRGIFEVNLDVNGKSVTVYGNHWPSQGNDVSHRLASSEQLLALARAKKSTLVMAVGDFNTIDSDKPHPFQILANDFHDAEQEARDLNVKLMPGTHNFKGQWSSLDRIFVHKNSKVMPNWKTFNILSQPWMMEKGQTGEYPKRFDAKTGEGFSDHLPIVIEADL